MLETIEGCEKGASDKPVVDVVIADCGRKESSVML